MIIVIFPIILLLFVYFLYPFFLYLLSFFKRKEKYYFESKMYSLSILIPVYNEEKSIVKKIGNLIEQNYPPEKIEIIVASDGSQDKTIEKVYSFQSDQIKLFDGITRRGKNAVLNEALNYTSGDILIFTDANATFDKDAIKYLTQHFNDERVGLVCGHLRYWKNETQNVAKGEGLYFHYEAFIKQLESRLGVLPVVTGSIYAIRRKLCTPLENEIANDFSHPVKVGALGYRILFEPKALAFEKATESISEEFWRRVRIVNRGLTAFFRFWKRYHLWKGLRGFTYVSHKFLRWFVPFYLLILFISNLFYLDHLIISIIFTGQLIFYSLAILGLFIKGRFFTIPLYFCLINGAALVGIVQYALGKRQTTWNVAQSTR
jgi:cellulose synthase/poly-beta-1,6-N-acetylglucosamine synthase-like glycosyltransferase